MEVQGIVVGWKKGVATVQVAAGACADCAQDCPAKAMAHPEFLQAMSAVPLSPGEFVRLDISLPPVNRAVLLAFGFPLVGLLAGIFLGSRLYGGAPLPSLGLAIAGVALAYGGAALAERRRHATANGYCTVITDEQEEATP